MEHVTLEQAQQSVGYLNGFLEKLRTHEKIDLTKICTFQEIANLHITMLRMNAYVNQSNNTASSITPTSTPAPSITPTSTPAPSITHIQPPVQAPGQQRSFQIHTI